MISDTFCSVNLFAVVAPIFMTTCLVDHFKNKCFSYLLNWPFRLFIAESLDVGFLCVSIWLKWGPLESLIQEQNFNLLYPIRAQLWCLFIVFGNIFLFDTLKYVEVQSVDWRSWWVIIPSTLCISTTSGCYHHLIFLILFYFYHKPLMFQKFEFMAVPEHPNKYPFFWEGNTNL